MNNTSPRHLEKKFANEISMVRPCKLHVFGAYKAAMLLNFAINLTFTKGNLK
eukprot:UN16961